MSRTPVVVSIGGSVVAGERIDPKAIEDLTSRLDAEVQGPLTVVAGGGAAAREYIEAARALGLDEAGLDEIGITMTRANAWLLISAFGPEAYPEPAENFQEALTALQDYDRVCMGGTHPGHTTDAVAAMAAERLRAERLVVATNVEGVYDRDPNEHDDAQLLEEVSFAQLVRIAGQARDAGSSTVIDPMAAQIIQRSRLPTRVVDGTKPGVVARAAAGEDVEGTLVEG